MAKEDIRRYSQAQLRELHKAGKTKTRPDAPEYELDEDFWQNAYIVFPSLEGKQAKTVRYDREILAYFQSTGKGWQTRMNAVLRAYVEAQKKKLTAKTKEKEHA